MLRRSLGLAVLLIAAACAPAAAAPLGLEDCGPTQGVHQCSGLVRTWDGIPLDTTVVLPSADARRLPLVVELPGFSNSKYEYLGPKEGGYTDTAFAWAREGYAVLTFTFRGFWGSCGTPEARAANPAECADGYVHFADLRYEVRDAQELIGRLVDEGIADRRRIGVTGDSGGGGPSLMLAALRDRVMLPDGSLIPWRSPAGRGITLAAAAPVIPWSDLVYAVAPNGRVFSHAITPRSLATSPVGVEKASYVNAILAAAQFAAGPGQPTGEPFIPGRPMGYLAPPGSDPSANVVSWVGRLNAGEPYTAPAAQAIVEQIVRFHSAYYVPPTRRPPPMLLASGFTDDLFPVDHVLRFANRTRARWPGLPLWLFLGDFGHPRASQEPEERERLVRVIHRWFDEHLRGRGRARRGATAFAQTCPRSAPAPKPFRARSFSALARGEVRFGDHRSQTVTSDGGDPRTGVALDPVIPTYDPCRELDAERAPGTATYTQQVTRPRGVTLIGSPTVIARLELSGAPPDVSQLAARLWDVDPATGKQRLVARGFYRPAAAARDVWQLYPAAWRFRAEHEIKLELLGNDAPYGRPSNGDFEIEVERLRLRLPVRQRPRGTIREPSRLPLLPGQKRARR